MSAALLHNYVYARPSGLESGRLVLSTSSAPDEEAGSPFLRARVTEPRSVALAMRLVSDVVRSRHHIPAAMLERILLESDPVLTFGGGVLRIEGFSSCAGIYARADVAQEALDPSEMRPGTTNVDFNAGMRAALAGVGDTAELDLAVGVEGVELKRDGATSCERKVALPARWLRGFAEVQAIQRRMVPRLELGRVQAIRLLRALPRSAGTSAATWLVPSGASVRIGATRRKGAVRVAGLSRLRALETALPLARALTVHEDPVTGASAWRLDSGTVAVTLVLSPETWRGFSGEGQVLSQLARSEPALGRVRALLSWQSALQSEDVAQQAGLPARKVEAALAWLAMQGLVGYDIGRGAWFHRVMPFDLEQTRRLLDASQPRLKSARKLVADGAVSVKLDGDGLSGEVTSGNVVHRVRIDAGGEHCTCTWYAKYRGERGPCKHVLAVELARSS